MGDVFRGNDVVSSVKIKNKPRWSRLVCSLKHLIGVLLLIDFLEDGDGAIGIFVVHFHAHVFHDKAQGHHGAVVLDCGAHIEGDGVAVDCGFVFVRGKGNGVALVVYDGRAGLIVPGDFGAVGFH